MPTVYRVNTTQARLQDVLEELKDFKDKGPYGLREAFWGGYAHTFFGIVHKNYALKSKGFSDSLGQRWHKLSPITIAIKEKITPANAEVINVRTGRMLESFFPGKLSNRKYFPTKDQVFTITNNKVLIGSKAPFITMVDSLRKLWLPSIGPWLSEALDGGVDNLIQRLIRALR